MTSTSSTRADIAARLKAARIQSGLSQGQVATILSLKRPAISEIEAGRRKVSAEELSHFAEIYDVSISWLAADRTPPVDPAVELAARELVKLKREDLETVLQLLRTLRQAT